MYQRILAPLDGSELAECTLVHIKTIALGCKVPEVFLLRVIEPLPAQTVDALTEAGGSMLSDLEEMNREVAREYINQTRAKLKAEGLETSAVIVSGHAAEEILKYAQDHKIDLIIMGTHGRSGISRWVMGSVTTHVINHSLCPVLTVTPKECRKS